MIPKSIVYKLVRKSDNIVIAEGNAKDIIRLRKKTRDTFVGVGKSTSQLNERFSNSSPFTIIQKD